ncbi:K+-sensing histidine kinase KdpD [Streptacidiphilus sp. MAP12-16]|uniref:DUF4118 domain-containing protein n=1 Tax=Streptacidiphilus sp. MAP12-16 TaxID=3156300 RepID=UPI0035125969
MAARWNRDRLALAGALLAPPAAAALLIPFRSTLPGADAALILVVVVVAVAANGDRLAGVLASLSAGVWFDFFLTRPYEHFTITSSADIRTTVLLLVVGLAVTELAVRGRKLRRIVHSGNEHAAGVRTTAELVASGAGESAVIDQVAVQLTELLALRGCRFHSGHREGFPPLLRPDGSVLWGAARWDVENLGLAADEIELPTRCRGETFGRFMLLPTPGTAPSLAARKAAVVLADLVGAMLAADAALEQPAPG